MAVDIRERGTVGCCYYVAREEKLYFMEDVKLGGVDVIDGCTFPALILRHIKPIFTVRIYIEPTVILVPAKIDDDVIEKLDPESRSGASGDGHSKSKPICCTYISKTT